MSLRRHRLGTGNVQKTPGIDYRTKFEMPVFKTPRSAPDDQPEVGLRAQYRGGGHA